MKRDILQSANYRFDFDRAMYINRSDKKAFSIEYIDDHSEEELERRIRESHPMNGWMFYFNEIPSASVQCELERVLG
jgi:hypothetical protein